MLLELKDRVLTMARPPTATAPPAQAPPATAPPATAPTAQAPPAQAGTAPAPPCGQSRFSSLASFYNGDERRLRSRELDVGLWWRDRGDGPLHRAAWVLDTGELYLVRLGPLSEGGGRVEVLARVSERERLEEVLDGWREHCGQPRSLAWLRGRARALGGRAPFVQARMGARTGVGARPRLAAAGSAARG